MYTASFMLRAPINGVRFENVLISESLILTSLTYEIVILHFPLGAIEMFYLSVYGRSRLLHTSRTIQNVYLIGAINNSPGR